MVAAKVEPYAREFRIGVLGRARRRWRPPQHDADVVVAFHGAQGRGIKLVMPPMNRDGQEAPDVWRRSAHLTLQPQQSSVESFEDKVVAHGPVFRLRTRRPGSRRGVGLAIDRVQGPVPEAQATVAQLANDALAVSGRAALVEQAAGDH